jgi:acetyl/propionyl-CoA carboxylase alpha subunit
MASKAEARVIAEQAGVPCIPGLKNLRMEDGESEVVKYVAAFAKEVGFPILLKAAMGGGGKGMRLVSDEAQIWPQMQRAASEALQSFGDSALVVEKYFPQSRHIEVQILADHHGQVFSIGDRDCSLQRRHQKVIEEAPAPCLAPEVRAKIQESARQLAQRVGYVSAGTVEYLLDWNEASQDKGGESFYFLEMNTRLQVEHPVSEEVFGLDLVEWQLRIAQGQSLPENFGKLQPRGHSIEARLYAEDVMQDFFPAPGEVLLFKPFQGPGIRWELGIDSQDLITGAFDPMIAKLIATGESRGVAMARLNHALGQTVFLGPENNREFLMDVSSCDAFASNVVHTQYLTTSLDPIKSRLAQQKSKGHGDAEQIFQFLAANGLSVSHPKSVDLFAAVTSHAYQPNHQFLNNEKSEKIQIEATWNYHQRLGDGLSHVLGRGRWQEKGESPRSFWYGIRRTPSEMIMALWLQGYSFKKTLQKTRGLEAGDIHGQSDQMVAPVPGKVIRVNIKAGDLVQEDQVLFVLESMKMEFEVKAPRDFSIAEVLVAEGVQVTTGQQLAHWTEETD